MGAVPIVDTWSSWMVLRFLTGLAIGGVWGPCSALIAEHWAPNYRARAASFVFSSFAIGAVVASVVGRWIITIDWRLLFAFGAISIPFALIVLRLIPPIRQSKKKSPTGPTTVGIGDLLQQAGADHPAGDLGEHRQSRRLLGRRLLDSDLP